MAGSITLRRRRISGQAEETVILRDGEAIASLPQGDPLIYALQLPARELKALRGHLDKALAARPKVREILDAIIEYKEQQPPA